MPLDDYPQEVQVSWGLTCVQGGNSTILAILQPTRMLENAIRLRDTNGSASLPPRPVIGQARPSEKHKHRSDTLHGAAFGSRRCQVPVSLNSQQVLCAPAHLRNRTGRW